MELCLKLFDFSVVRKQRPDQKKERKKNVRKEEELGKRRRKPSSNSHISKFLPKHNTHLYLNTLNLGSS